MAPKPNKSKKKTRKSTKAVLSPPHDLTNAVELADWLELLALTSKDRNASKADLATMLKRAGGYHPAKDKTAVENLCLSAFNELESRPKSADRAYPFTVRPGLLTAKVNAVTSYPAYVFCLCLSAWRWIRPQEQPDKARQLFEDLSCFAAKNYLGGEVLRFASPRESKIKKFNKAVDHLCALIGEGVGFAKAQSAGNKKDDTLDVVAWKHSPDHRHGKLVLFGQCASGGDWKAKRNELAPGAFLGQWAERQFTVDCVRAFFVPHRIHFDDWEETARKGGIPFDRCRVSYWAQRTRPIPKQQKLVDWSKSVISVQ